MRSAADLWTIAGVKLSLDLEPGVDPITGRLELADGSVRSFTGWLELTQALEAARQGDPSRDKASIGKRSWIDP
jgi:hypothetical protein